MAKSDLRIDVLGTTITITADEEQEYLNKLLDKYRRTIENVQRVSGLKDPLKTAILTGFLLCDDLEKAGSALSGSETAQKESGEAEQLTLSIISRLDEALQVTDTQKVTDTIFKLQNTVKNYDWGSAEWLPAFLGQKNLSRIPWAELWIGVNPAGPSRLVSGGEELLLSELIDRDRLAFLGKETAETFGKLPFLLKLEAAAKPLSIQAHPNPEQAREGFDRENREGIPIDAPNRNYRDSNHKPEIICAISPFAALCGFRKAAAIKNFIDILCGEEAVLEAGLESLVSALVRQDENPYKAFLAALFNLDSEVLDALGSFVKTHVSMLVRNFPEYRDEWELCSYLAGLYPRDPGVIAPLYLNIVELAPGEAMYLPAGVFHAYIHGMGLELMADSDNVLRGGLTHKYVDQQELFRILSFSEYRPEILKAPEPAPAWFSYPAPEREFTLSVMHSSGAPLPFPETGPAIVLVTQGSAVITGPSIAVSGANSGANNSAETVLSRGESAFIAAGDKMDMVFSGTFTAYIASCVPSGRFPMGTDSGAAYGSTASCVYS